MMAFAYFQESSTSTSFECKSKKGLFHIRFSKDRTFNSPVKQKGLVRALHQSGYQYVILPEKNLEWNTLSK